MSLASEINITHSFAAYSLLSISPGETKTMNLGPFEVLEEGEHKMFAEMGDAVVRSGLDSFSVYGQDTLHTAYAGIALGSCLGIVRVAVVVPKEKGCMKFILTYASL